MFVGTVQIVFVRKEVQLPDVIAVFIVKKLNVQQLLHQTIVALHSTQFNLLDNTDEVILSEIAVDVEDSSFDVRLVLAQVANVLSDTLDDSSILATGAHTILLNLIVANEFIKFSSKFRIIIVGVELRPEIESVLW